MHSFLKQSTAAQSRSIGPFLDETDFKTAETALTIANTDIKLMINGAASANKNSGGGTHRVNGVYGITFDATDTATVGEILVSVVVAGALPVFATFVVVEEAVYDMLFGASAIGYIANQPVDLNTIKTQTVTCAGGVTVPAATLASTTNITAGTITTVTTTTTATNLTNAPTAGDFTATMKTSIGTAVAASAVASVTGNVGGNVTGSVGSVVGAVGSVTGAVGSVTGAVGSVTGAVGSVTGNVGGNVVGSVASVVGAVGSVTGLTASDVGAIKAKTDSLTFTVASVLDANVQRINDVTITGDGQVGTEFGV